MGKAVKIFGRVLSTVLVVLIVVLAILLAGVRLIGYTPYTVLSGSMEPTYHVGSLVYVKKVDPTTLKVGDPITFYITGNVIATHRIIEVHGAGTPELGFRTQGDANKTVDGITPASAVVGKVAFSIPYLGYVSNLLQQPKGLICVVGGSAVVLILSYLIDALVSKPKEAASDADAQKNNG